jgi:hypothetical protein
MQEHYCPSCMGFSESIWLHCVNSVLHYSTVTLYFYILSCYVRLLYTVNYNLAILTINRLENSVQNLKKRGKWYQSMNCNQSQFYLCLCRPSLEHIQKGQESCCSQHHIGTACYNFVSKLFLNSFKFFQFKFFTCQVCRIRLSNNWSNSKLMDIVIDGDKD